MSDATSSSHVKSATRTLDIIEYVVARDRPVVAQEIAAALLIPVSSLSYLLGTLVERHYLVREGRRYRAGPGLERLQARSLVISLEERVAPVVRALRLQLNETTSFFVRRGWEVEALVTETSEHALRYAINIGTRTPMHCVSSGKAVLAALSDTEVELFLAETDRAKFTATTIVDPAGIRAEIAETRRTGVAHTREEYSVGIQGIGRAVMADGELLGSLSVAIPNVRFDADVERRAIDLLLKASGLLEAG